MLVSTSINLTVSLTPIIPLVWIRDASGKRERVHNGDHDNESAVAHDVDSDDSDVENAPKKPAKKRARGLDAEPPPPSTKPASKSKQRRSRANDDEGDRPQKKKRHEKQKKGLKDKDTNKNGGDVAPDSHTEAMDSTSKPKCMYFYAFLLFFY